MAILKYRDPITGTFIPVPAVEGPAGIGIESIQQTVYSDEPSGQNVITVNRSTGEKDQFIVTNGVGITNIELLAEGDAAPVEKTESSATNRYRFHLSDNTYKDIGITNGVGIANIEKTSSSTLPGGENTITITLSNGDIRTYTVRNGDAGGVLSIQEGEPGYIIVHTHENEPQAIKVGSPLNITNDVSDLNDTSKNQIYVLGSVPPTTNATENILRYNTGVRLDCTTGVLFGAAWNDYAEFRDQNEQIEPGYVAYCDDDGKLKKTTERLQKFEGVVSDTYGFSIGETDNCKTPIAVSGRVLVYADPEEEHFHSGDVVCAGPDGLVYRMEREEIMEFPDRIVGVVSEIPTYETWGTSDVKVNGRIWVKVK